MSPVRTWPVLLTAALLAVGCAASAPAAEITDDFKYLPSNTTLLFIVRMDRLLSSESFKKLRKEIPMIETEFEGSFRKEFGFEISNVDLMTYGGNVNSKGPVGVFRLKTAVKPETLIKAASAPRYENDKGTTYKDEKIGALTVHVPDAERREAFCFLNDKTLVFGRAKELKAVLERTKKPELAAIQLGLKEADPKATITIVLDLRGIAAVEKPPMVPGVNVDKIVESVNGASLTIKIGNESVIRGVAVCKDAAAAVDVKKEAEALQKFVQELMKMAPPGAVSKDILELPSKVKLSTKGNLGEATLAVSDDLAISIFKLWMVPQRKPPAEKKP